MPPVLGTHVGELDRDEDRAASLGLDEVPRVDEEADRIGTAEEDVDVASLAAEVAREVLEVALLAAPAVDGEVVVPDLPQLTQQRRVDVADGKGAGGDGSA